MGKTSKIIIGIIVVAVIAWLGYMFFGGQNNSANTTNTVQGGNNTSDVIQHLERTLNSLNSGGGPGNGVGG